MDEQQKKLDLIAKITGVAEEALTVAKTQSDNWNAQLRFALRLSEVLQADAQSKQQSVDALKALAEDVRLGKL